MSEERLLTVSNLRTEFFQGRKKSVVVVDDVSFHIDRGEIVGLVGESGCGKSVTSLSIMQLFKGTTGKVTGGEIIFENQNLLKCTTPQLRKIRGGSISMIFQEPMSALNPSMRVQKQMVEGICLHEPISGEEAVQKSLEMLKKVGIPDTGRVIRNYPHQLSGGMSQRVMIAMAMACNPRLLIADEPTTALDVTIQAQILDLMRSINETQHTGILLITHDLGVVAEMCSRVIVMYAGRIVEEAPVQELFEDPLHPYTKGLIASVPKLGSGIKRLPSIPGSVPDLSMMPPGCKFAPRCSCATDICREKEPELKPVGTGRFSRCWL